MNALTTKVQQTIARFAFLREGEAVVVALSGGADSVALLLVLIELGYAVEAAHCNFHLREGAADADMAFVETLCARHNVPLHLRHFDTLSYAKAEGISIEMAARTLRYEWFATFEQPIAVGHHAEDNAETLLLNLCRGSGLAGLAGIRHRNGQIVRPLLDCRRVDIEAYLAKRGETFCTDVTNFDTQYRRNKVRHEVIPLLTDLNPDIAQTLHETALRLREVEQVYRFGLEQLQQTLMASLPDGFRINYDALTKAPAPATLLHEWLSPLGFMGEAQLLTAPVGTLLEGKGFLATRTTDAIEVRRVPQPCFSLESLCIEHLHRNDLTAIPRDKTIACLDADKIKGELKLRSPKEGDRFCPFGLRGSKLVSDFLTDRHFSRIDKLAVRLLCDDEGILWIVGERIAQRVALTPETQHILLIHSSSV